MTESVNVPGEGADTDRLPLEIFHELVRIFGDPKGAPAEWVIVGLVSEEDALTFLRTVPAGTPLTHIPELVAAYRASHPLLSDSEPERPG